MGIGTSNQTSLKRRKYPFTSSSSKPSSPTSESPADIEIDFHETYTIVWLDLLHENTDLQHFTERLGARLSYPMVFKSQNLCEKWLRSLPVDSKILIVVSSDSPEEFLNNFQCLSSVYSIYFLYSDMVTIQKLMIRFSKIRAAAASNMEELLEKLSEEINYLEELEDLQGMKIVQNYDSSQPIDSELASFLWFQLFLDVLTSPNYFKLPASPNELINMLSSYNSTGREFHHLREEFNNEYDEKHATTWLINNRPLGRALTNALCKENVSLLFYLRFFLTHIHTELIDHQLNSVHAYRKQIMSLKDIQNIKNKQGGYISFNGFLFASLIQPTFSVKDSCDDQHRTVLLEIDANYQHGISPFAYVQRATDVSNDNNNNTLVIFMCGSIFKINSFIMDHNSIYYIQLLLINAQDLNVLHGLKQQQKHTNDPTIITNLLRCTNHHNKIETYNQHIAREFASSNAITQRTSSACLRTVQFIVVGLFKYQNELTAAMLNTLRLLINGSLLIYDESEDINYDTIYKEKILVFTTDEYINTIASDANKKISFYVLGSGSNNSNVQKCYSDLKDLIFELADQLYQYFMSEAEEDSKRDTMSAKEKENMAKRIHVELKHVYRNNYTIIEDNESSISSTVKLVQLRTRSHPDTVDKINDRFKDIMSEVLVYYDENECHFHLCTTEFHTAIFLICASDCQETTVCGLERLPNVKKAYRIDKLSMLDNDTECSTKYFYSRLAHDLLQYHNMLATHYSRHKNAEKAKEMLLKAQKLCQLLLSFK